MATPDYSNMTDEELDLIINSPANLRMVEAPTKLAPPEGSVGARVAQHYADTAQGMDPVTLALAGMGAGFNELGQGAKEKLQMLFASKEAEPELLAQIATDRAERKKMDEALLANPVASFGNLVGKLAPAAAAPARLPAQMAVEAALSFAGPGSEKPTGLGNELSSSGLDSLISSGTMGAVGKGLQGAGKVLGATTGDLTEEGVRALRTKAAATRLGLPPTSVGQLYPASTAAEVEKNLPGYASRVTGQAKELRKVLDRPTVLPEGEVSDVGRSYVDELAKAGESRMRLAADKYKDVDRYVEEKGLGGFTPMYAARAITNYKNPGYEVATNLLERYGFNASATRGATANELGQVPLTFENYHTMRVATNKALHTIQRGMASAEAQGAAIPAENAAAAKYLRDFKVALDSDAEAWAKRNASNAEAVKKYQEATEYFRDVAGPTVLSNKLARKAMSKTKGFESGNRGLSAATSTEGMHSADLLYPTMTQRGQDMTDVLRNLPDVRSTALSQDLTPPRSGFGALRLAQAAAGRPLATMETAISRLPGLRGLSESDAAARLMGARNSLVGASPTVVTPLQALKEGALRARIAPRQGLLPRAAWGAAQVPQEALDERVRRLIARTR